MKRSACGKMKGMRMRKKRVCKEDGVGEDSAPSSIGLPKHGRCGGRKSPFSHHSGPRNRSSALCIHVLGLLPRHKSGAILYFSAFQFSYPFSMGVPLYSRQSGLSFLGLRQLLWSWLAASAATTDVHRGVLCLARSLACVLDRGWGMQAGHQHCSEACVPLASLSYKKPVEYVHT